MTGPTAAIDPKPILSSRIDATRRMKASLLRAQGRFDALHHPQPSLACRPAHKQEVADDRDWQPSLHRLLQSHYRQAGQPRVFGLRGRIDRKRPLRIVGDVEGKLGEADVSEPMIEGRRRADRKCPVDQPRTVRRHDHVFRVDVAMAQPVPRLLQAVDQREDGTSQLGDVPLGADGMDGAVDRLVPAGQQIARATRRLCLEHGCGVGHVAGELRAKRVALVLPVLLGITLDEVLFLLEAAERTSIDEAIAEQAPLGMATALTTAEGLPERGWYRHFIYAPGDYTGYSVKTLPAVREAIEQKKWDEVNPAAAKTAGDSFVILTGQINDLRDAFNNARIAGLALIGVQATAGAATAPGNF